VADLAMYWELSRTSGAVGACHRRLSERHRQKGVYAAMPTSANKVCISLRTVASCLALALQVFGWAVPARIGVMTVSRRTTSAAIVRNPSGGA